MRSLHWSTLWGVVGYLALLSSAVARLTPLALEPIRSGEMVGWQWLLMAVFMVFMIYSEGYRGFWKAVGPRVSGRALHLARPGNSLVRRLLAPLFCMSLFGATRKRLIVSWCLYSGIILLVVAVRQLSQPYRGIVDAGVVVGLAMGCASVLYFFARALTGASLPVPTDVPETDIPKKDSE